MTSRHVETALENLGFKQWVKKMQKQCALVTDDEGNQANTEEYLWFTGIFMNDKYQVTVYEYGETDKIIINIIQDGKVIPNQIDDGKPYTIKEGIIRLKELCK